MRTPEVSSCWGTGGRSLRTDTVTTCDPVHGEHDLGDPLGEPLEQREPLGGDDGLDGLGERAVVDGVVELVGLPGGR